MGRRDDLDRFYALLQELALRTGGPRLLSDGNCKDGLPQRGVYFFFEPGELRADGKTPRVVRVGTHAVSDGSKTNLWNRLSQHRGRVGGSHAGGGNHRGSIFRLHVGTALLNRGLASAIPAQHWGSPNRQEDPLQRAAEHRVEQEVSQYIRTMPFLWLAVDDPPTKHSDRKVIEANAIALLSNYRRVPMDPASSRWLGCWADREAVRNSDLWNVDHVAEEYNPAFLPLLQRYVITTAPIGRTQAAESVVQSRSK